MVDWKTMEDISTTPAANAPMLRILIVDINLDHLEMLAEVMQHFGHEVATASSYADAARHAQKMRPHVIVTGMRLIDCNGEELAEKFRNEPTTEDTVLIAMTGRSIREESGAFVHFDRVLNKPFDLATFAQLLAEYPSLAVRKSI